MPIILARVHNICMGGVSNCQYKHRYKFTFDNMYTSSPNLLMISVDKVKTDVLFIAVLLLNVLKLDTLPIQIL